MLAIILQVEVLEEEVRRHIQTIETLNNELGEARNIKLELENEYIKLSGEHFMLQNALKDDSDMMKDSHASVKKVQSNRPSTWHPAR